MTLHIYCIMSSFQQLCKIGPTIPIGRKRPKRIKAKNFPKRLIEAEIFISQGCLVLTLCSMASKTKTSEEGKRF